MSAGAPPLRFLVLVAGGWICVRAAMLAPDWWTATGAAAPAVPLTGSSPALPPVAKMAATEPAPPLPLRPGERRFATPWIRTVAAAPPAPFELPAATAAAFAAAPASALRAVPPIGPAAGPNWVPERRASRWSGSAWLLARDDGGPALAPGGTLGGSQAGARLLYRLNRDAARPLALSARAYAPLDQVAGAEAAVGIDWRPSAEIPVHLLAERRQALGGDGRSAFSLTVYGGVSDRPLGAGLTLDAYAQAGLVGLRSRDAFADGSVRIGRAVGPVDLGAAAWAAAQPGAERIDAGPQLRFRMPVEGATLTFSAEYRFRIAGDAAPGSGPALTLAAGF